MNTRALFFVLVMAAFVLSGAAAAAWTAARSFRRRRRSVGEGSEPRCGRCGYIVHPGSRRICPECGADYAAVGVFTPSSAPPDCPVLVVWFSAVLLAAVAWFGAPRLAQLVPWGWNFRANETFEPRPGGGYTQAVSVTATGWGRWRSHRIDFFKVTYHARRFPVMHVNPRDATCQVVCEGKADDPRPTDLAAMRRFAECAGFPPGTKDGERLANELHEAVGWILRREFSGRQGLRSTNYYPNEKAVWVAGGAMWSMGMFLVLLAAGRRHGRRKALAAQRSRRLLQDLRLAA